MMRCETCMVTCKCRVLFTFTTSDRVLFQKTSKCGGGANTQNPVEKSDAAPNRIRRIL